MKKILIAINLFTIGVSSFASNKPVCCIDSGGDCRYYSNDDLKRRVWELERAVMQLQSDVFKLSVQNQNQNQNGNWNGGLIWTCQVQAFGKTHVASNNNRYTAVALVLKKMWRRK